MIVTEVQRFYVQQDLIYQKGSLCAVSYQHRLAGLLSGGTAILLGLLGLKPSKRSDDTSTGVLHQILTSQFITVANYRYEVAMEEF